MGKTKILVLLLSAKESKPQDKKLNSNSLWQLIIKLDKGEILLDPRLKNSWTNQNKKYF